MVLVGVITHAGAPLARCPIARARPKAMAGLFSWCSVLLALLPQMSFENHKLALSCFLPIQPLLLNPPRTSPLCVVLVSR